MNILIDLATMAVMHPGGIPVTDLSLVRGDKLPLRITLLDEGTPVTPSGTRPALAVKTALGDDTLVLATTNLEPVDDALGLAYVGSLSVNTTQLIAAMGSADRIDLVGEVVIIGGDGSQRTSSLIKVRVRQDIMPANVVPPDDVIVNWEEMVAASLANQLPDALQAAGVHVTPTTGSSLLDTGAAETPTMMACYAITWGDELLAGHLTDHSRVRQVVMTYLSGDDAHGSYWLRIWRLVQGAYVAVGISAPVTLPGDNEPVTWTYSPGVSLTRGDKIILEVCTGADADHLTTYAMGVHGVMTPAKDGRGRADQVSHPVVITQYDVAPRMTVTVDYDDGVLVGGVEVATVTQVQALGTDVRTAAGNSQAAAQSAAAARDEAQEAVAGLAITTGTITTGDPGSQATATLTPGSTPGSWQLEMTIPRGDVGAVDTSQAYVWNQPQTYDAMINANGGVNIPLAAGAAMDTAAVNRAYALGMAHLVLMNQARTYWITSSCTATNGVTINHVVPGIYCDARLGGNGRTSLTMRTTGVIGASNYSKIMGYSIPVRNSVDSPGAWSKTSLLIGAGGQWVEQPDGDMDAFRFRPVSGSTPAIARLIEVTLYYQDGYKARVRELIGVGKPPGYVVRTTESSLNYDSNTGPSAAGYRLIIAQSEQSYTDALAASVWLVMGGAANDTVIKLASIRGWDTYHVNAAPVLYLDAQAPSYGGYIQMESPTVLNGIGNNTYVRYGLEPYQRSWITSETEVPYADPEQPTA